MKLSKRARRIIKQPTCRVCGKPLSGREVKAGTCEPCAHAESQEKNR